MHPRPFLTAEWRHLVMLSYEIDPGHLAPHVPAGTELDSWHGSTFVSVVGFRFLNTRVLGLPIPFHRHFEELNVRFYVRRQHGRELRRAVVFIRELVPRRAVAALARAVYDEPYVALPMRSRIAGGDAPQVEYAWRVAGRWHTCTAAAVGAAAIPAADTLEAFITEHYWGYTGRRERATIEYRVDHPPWAVWQAQAACSDADLASLSGAQVGSLLHGAPRSALIADGSAVTVFRPTRLVDTGAPRAAA